jgi:hypothetical protein
MNAMEVSLLLTGVRSVRAVLGGGQSKLAFEGSVEDGWE